jgi:hypothetical protein
VAALQYPSTLPSVTYDARAELVGSIDHTLRPFQAQKVIPYLIICTYSSYPTIQVTGYSLLPFTLTISPLPYTDLQNSLLFTPSYLYSPPHPHQKAYSPHPSVFSSSKPRNLLRRLDPPHGTSHNLTSSPQAHLSSTCAASQRAIMPFLHPHLQSS